jgi:hypothetical protein
LCKDIPLKQQGLRLDLKAGALGRIHSISLIQSQTIIRVDK